MKTRIYIDTSVVGGFFDEEFQEDTKRFYKWFEENDVVFVISDLLDIELINAPEKVRNSLGKYDNSKFERIKLSQESIVLANEYIKHKVVGISSLEDCRNIAMSTVHKVDYVVSWNFKHIVNIDRIIGYNSVNLMLGYEPVEIYTPFQLLNHENQ